VAALLLSAWLLANSTLHEAIVALIAAAIGFVIYLTYRIANGKRQSGKIPWFT